MVHASRCTAPLMLEVSHTEATRHEQTHTPADKGKGAHTEPSVAGLDCYRADFSVSTFVFVVTMRLPTASNTPPPSAVKQQARETSHLSLLSFILCSFYLWVQVSHVTDDDSLNEIMNYYLSFQLKNSETVSSGLGYNKWQNVPKHKIYMTKDKN